MKIVPTTKRLSFTLRALMIVVGAWMMAWAGSARANQEPKETEFSSAPPMHIHIYRDEDNDGQYDDAEEVADGETFEVYLDMANPKTAARYFSDVGIRFFAIDDDTVIPPPPPPDPPVECDDQFLCRDESHPGPPPTPARQTWPGPTLIDFSSGKDTPITEPTTITVTMTWKDDGYFGNGFISSDGCIRCYAGRLEPDTKDPDVVKTITIKVLERCPCSIEILSEGELPKGQDSEIVVRIKNESQNLNDVTLCDYDVTASILQKDAGVDIPGFPATESVGLFRGEQKTVTFTPIRPANTSALGNATLKITSIVPSNAGGGSCEETQQLSVICEEDTPEATTFTFDATALWNKLAGALNLPLEVPEEGSLEFVHTREISDCCSDDDFRQDGLTTERGSVNLDFEFKEVYVEAHPALKPFEEKTVSLAPFCDKLKIEVRCGLVLSGTIGGHASIETSFDKCDPDDCIDWSIGVHGSIDGSVEASIKASCSGSVLMENSFVLVSGQLALNDFSIERGCPEREDCVRLDIGPLTVRGPQLTLFNRTWDPLGQFTVFRRYSLPPGNNDICK